MSVTLMIIGRRRPGQTIAAHRRHMRDVHGPLVQDYIARHPASAPRRYVQNHVMDGWFAEGDPVANRLARQPDFITEVGFPDPASARASRETEHYLTHLRPDEGNMVDEASVTGFPASRRVVSGAGSTGDGFKVFALLAPAEGIEPARMLDRWSALSEALGASIDASHEQARVMVPAPVSAIDVFRTATIEAAHELAEVHRRMVLMTLHAEGLVTHAGCCLLIAKKHVLFAGDGSHPAQKEDLS